MPSKTGQMRPRTGLGLGSNVDARRTINKSAKPTRNVNQVKSAKPSAPARREPRR